MITFCIIIAVLLLLPSLVDWYLMRGYVPNRTRIQDDPGIQQLTKELNERASKPLYENTVTPPPGSLLCRSDRIIYLFEQPDIHAMGRVGRGIGFVIASKVIDDYGWTLILMSDSTMGWTLCFEDDKFIT